MLRDKVEEGLKEAVTTTDLISNLMFLARKKHIELSGSMSRDNHLNNTPTDNCSKNTEEEKYLKSIAPVITEKGMEALEKIASEVEL